jgi:hypothetical protein
MNDREVQIFNYLDAKYTSAELVDLLGIEVSQIWDAFYEEIMNEAFLKEISEDDLFDDE